jgi:hypothetical protein
MNDDVKVEFAHGQVVWLSGKCNSFEVISLSEPR